LVFVAAARFWGGQPFATTRTKLSQYENSLDAAGMSGGFGAGFFVLTGKHGGTKLQTSLRP
jgi:hypothetical protein